MTAVVYPVTKVTPSIVGDVVLSYRLRNLWGFLLWGFLLWGYLLWGFLIEALKNFFHQSFRLLVQGNPVHISQLQVQQAGVDGDGAMVGI